MRISRLFLQDFKRFTQLTVEGLPETARLIVLAGPNGSGKSSLFDAFVIWRGAQHGGWRDDQNYYRKGTTVTIGTAQRVTVNFHGIPPTGENAAEAFYFRTAYRNDPEFLLNNLERVGLVTEERRFFRMIETDAAVTANYRRLASQAFEDVFAKEDAATTVGAFRERVVGTIKDSIQGLFPDLRLNTLGNPLEQGTFRFDKGQITGFEYKNLSGGEKAAFDLILDMIVKRPALPNAVYCIDEPDAHMNTRLQGALLGELFNLLPPASQLWIATHSIGMMRKARELSDARPGTVFFLNFAGYDFDKVTLITPSKPTRAFWESVLSVALDDLAELVAPKEVVVCEGNPVTAVPSKNAEHDAICYDTIFSDEFPDVKFLSAGNAASVASDRLGFVAALPKIVSGIVVRRLIDRDDHAAADVATFKAGGISVLRRRHIESYLYDDEVLAALCVSVGKPTEAPALIAEKQKAIAGSIRRGNPTDDVKSAAGDIYLKAKIRLGLTAVGNDQRAFARSTLAPLIKPGMAVYEELRTAIFGP